MLLLFSNICDSSSVSAWFTAVTLQLSFSHSAVVSTFGIYKQGFLPETFPDIYLQLVGQKSPLVLWFVLTFFRAVVPKLLHM